jgi:hypothetical protein
MSKVKVLVNFKSGLFLCPRVHGHAADSAPEPGRRLDLKAGLNEGIELSLLQECVQNAVAAGLLTFKRAEDVWTLTDARPRLAFDQQIRSAQAVIERALKSNITVRVR